MQAVLENTNEGTFAELATFVASQHRAGVAAGSCAGRQRLPAALTVAGGVNSADHARTFPALADLLRSQVRVLSIQLLIGKCCAARRACYPLS